MRLAFHQKSLDGAPKHAEDYAKHGIKCLVPLKSYNDHLDNANIFHFNSYHQAVEVLENERLLDM